MTTKTHSEKQLSALQRFFDCAGLSLEANFTVNTEAVSASTGDIMNGNASKAVFSMNRS